MTRWELAEPATIDLAGVRAVNVRLVAGNVDVAGTTGPPRLELTAIEGQPLTVRLDDGVLTVAYDDLSWRGLLGWTRGRDRAAWLSLAVPPGCPVELGVVSASALVSGMTAPVEVRSVSGEVTLDGLVGDVSARTVSGDVETQALDGRFEAETVSGELTVAGGRCDAVRARSVSGGVALDVESRDVRVDTVSGDVLVRLPDGAGVTVDVRTLSGRLDSGFDSVRAERRRLSGRVGDGEGTLAVETVSGRVAVLRR